MKFENNAYIFNDEDDLKIFIFELLTRSDFELGFSSDMSDHDKNDVKDMFINMYKTVLDGIKRDPSRKGMEIKMELDF